MKCCILKVTKFSKLIKQEHICDKVKSRTRRLSGRTGEDRVGQEGKKMKVENGEVQRWDGLNAS